MFSFLRSSKSQIAAQQVAPTPPDRAKQFAAGQSRATNFAGTARSAHGFVEEEGGLRKPLEEALDIELNDLGTLKTAAYVDLDGLGLGYLRPCLVILRDDSGVVVLFDSNHFGIQARSELLATFARIHQKPRMRPASSALLASLHKTHETRLANSQAKIDSSQVESLLDQILASAIDREASDLHMEVRDSYVDIYFRIFGHRTLAMTVSRDLAFALAGLLYDVRADHGAKRKVNWSPDEAVDAIIGHKMSDGREIQIRFATAPIYPRGCFQMVCRLLSMDPKMAPPFGKLGYTSNQQRLIQEMAVGSQGLILLVGPTNSGKSTTMQALAKFIMEQRGAGIKVESIEDPVEYVIPGASQMPVSSRADFATLLKSTLRHDPDVLIVGEVRDSESAESIKNIVLAGHKVLGTLHAYDALAAFTRLNQIGVPADVLYMRGFVSGIIFQRLLPRLCPHCSIDYDVAISRGLLPDDVVQRVDRVMDVSGSNVRVQNPHGCDHCKDKAPGLSGRVICAEVVRPSERMLDALKHGHTQAAYVDWSAMECDTGFGPNALGHALYLMAQGMVDPRHVEAEVDLIRAWHAPSAGASCAPVVSTASFANTSSDSALQDLYERT